MQLKASTTKYEGTGRKVRAGKKEYVTKALIMPARIACRPPPDTDLWEELGASHRPCPTTRQCRRIQAVRLQVHVFREHDADLFSALYYQPARNTKVVRMMNCVAMLLQFHQYLFQVGQKDLPGARVSAGDSLRL
jgi:hypothetical protein